MTAQELIDDISGAAGVSEQILELIAGLDPDVAIPAAILEKLLPLLVTYLSKGLTAWSNASGTPITVETVMALLPNPDPLTPPAA